MPSKRSVLNLNVVNGLREYAFINHFHQGTTASPFGTTFSTGTVWNSDILDDEGWPTLSFTSTSQWSCGALQLPSSTNFAGPYVLTWEGQGRIALLAGTWTVNAGLSSGYVENSNGNYTGTDPYIVLTYSGAGGSVSNRFVASDSSSTGAYAKRVKFYRLEDEADLDAGKVYRDGWKQIIVDNDPGAIRFMNQFGGNGAQLRRFSQRKTPANGPTYGQYNWLASPPYGETTGTNAYALASATGMPGAMTNGEVVTCRMGNAMVRGGAKTITGITKANPGVVTSTAHGFSDGDIVVFVITVGMTQLSYKPCTVANKTNDTFELSGVNTSGFSNFSAGTVMQYITLNVGSRGTYPVVFPDGINPGSSFGSGYIAAGEYLTFYFDSDLVASTDISGAWVFEGNAGGAGNVKPANVGTPLEILTKMVVELNEMGWSGDMWVNVPAPGLLSMDDDYSVGENVAVGVVDVILNGASGYPGLPSDCNLLVEFSNETWNFGAAFTQTSYLARRGVIRDATTGPGATNVSYFSTLRACVMAKEVRAAFSSETRLKLVMAGQGTLGISGTNSSRINGNATIDADALFISLGGGDPIDYFDYFAWAGYFLAGSTFDNANLATLASDFAAASTDAAREELCAEYVVGVEGSGSGETVSRYRDTLLPAYNTELGNHGKATIMYEGGWDKTVTGGTAEVNTFLVAVKSSKAWAHRQYHFLREFNAYSNAYLPAIYVMLDARWGFADPDTYSGGVEGDGLSEAWTRMGLHNNGRFRLEVTLT